MKKLLLAAVVALLPSFAHAQTGYIEGSLGVVLLPDVQTHNYTIATPGGVFIGNAETQYDANWAFGLEGGFQTGPWRFGVSWDFLKTSVEKARVEGTLNGAPFTAELTDQQLGTYGIGANNDVNLFALNAYYVFGMHNLGSIFTGVQPYIGVGAGAAAVNNASTEFTFLATLGADMPLGQGFYVGGRYRFALITGPTGDNGIKFSEITAHVISVVLGYRFGVRL